MIRTHFFLRQISAFLATLFKSCIFSRVVLRVIRFLICKKDSVGIQQFWKFSNKNIFYGDIQILSKEPIWSHLINSMWSKTIIAFLWELVFDFHQNKLIFLVKYSITFITKQISDLKSLFGAKESLVCDRNWITKTHLFHIAQYSIVCIVVQYSCIVHCTVFSKINISGLKFPIN